MGIGRASDSTHIPSAPLTTRPLPLTDNDNVQAASQPLTEFPR